LGFFDALASTAKAVNNEVEEIVDDYREWSTDELIEELNYLKRQGLSHPIKLTAVKKVLKERGIKK